MTLVLPLPAPASTRSGPLVLSTASFWRGFRLLISVVIFEDIAVYFTRIGLLVASVVRVVFIIFLRKVLYVCKSASL